MQLIKASKYLVYRFKVKTIHAVMYQSRCSYERMVPNMLLVILSEVRNAMKAPGSPVFTGREIVMYSMDNKSMSEKKMTTTNRM